MIPSLLVLLIIMGYYFFRPRLRIRLNRSFLAVLTIDILTELFECLSARLNETWTYHDPLLLRIVNLLFFVFYISRGYMFFVFSISVLDSRAIPRSKWHAGVPVIYFVSLAILLSNPLTGWVFRIQDGFHTGPLYWVIYACSGCYLIFATLAVIRHRKELNFHTIISLLFIQGILGVGNLVRYLLPTYIVMNTFCLMAIVIIFISFLNPDLFLSDRGYVYNLSAFQALISESYRRKRPCRVLGFSIQNYQEHREIFGGKQMDAALSQISRWLAESFPHLSAFYLRNGFFAVVSQNTDLAELSGRIRNRFAETWQTGTGELRLSVSFVEADTEVLDCTADRLINTLLISQDELSRVAEPDASLSLVDSIEEINRKLEIRRCLENALEQDGLLVYLQPLVDCSTNRIVAAEALVRLQDEKGSIIRPDLFITLAEREGYIVRLGEQVLGKVCRFIRDNDLDALGIRWINVNLSPVQFMSRDIPSRFSSILKLYGVSPEKVHLEITEQSMIDFSLLREQITGLHENGFQFALDDYGSGYSNLSRVRQYPFGNIKIDMEVVRNYCRDKDLLLPALVQAFKKMNLSVTAEGIETEEMAAELKAIGCDYLQGFFFSRPVSMADFLKLPGFFPQCE